MEIKIRSKFFLALGNRLAYSDRAFQKMFNEKFFELEEILDITPELYRDAIAQKAKEIYSEDSKSLETFLANLDYFTNAL